MEHKARYSVVRYMPDPVRGEFANIGIVLQAEFGILYRLLPPRLRKKSFAEVPLRELQTAEEICKARFGEDAHMAIDRIQPEYLEHCQRLFSRTIRLSEIRSLTLEFDDPYLLEEHLLSLFELLVLPAPKPREYVLPKIKRLRPKVKHDFQLWEIYDTMEEESVIFGTIPWKMDYAYKSNGNDIGIKLVDFGWKGAIHIAGETWGAWMDVAQERANTQLVKAVFGNYSSKDDEHRSAMRLLRKMDVVYDYDNPTERNELESMLRREVSLSKRME